MVQHAAGGSANPAPGNPVRPVLFIQGGGAGTHADWDNRLVASLTDHLGPGYALHYPTMPNEDDPELASWGAAIAVTIEALDGGVVLIGHSIGGTILVHTLARQPALLQHLAAVCLIAAPFVGPGGWPSAELSAAPGWAAPLTAVPVYLYQGDADETTPMAHLDLYAAAMPHALLRRLAGHDHQLNNDLAPVARDIGSLTAPAIL